MESKINLLKKTVIDNDYCVGCGICASIENSPFEMKLNKNGMYKPSYKKNESDINLKKNIAALCPFSNESMNETELGNELFEKYGSTYNKYTGHYLKNFGGYVIEGKFRQKGSSGGMGSWIATKLLENGMVDGIIHVKENKNKGNQPIFEYQISKTAYELSKGAKSKYYPIELSKVIQIVKENKGHYALIGIPCFIKSVRLLAKEDPIIKDRIKYFIGLVCGHLKSTMFAKSIGWELGIEPENLTHIDFRKKLSDRGSNDYGVEVTGNIENEIVMKESPTKQLFTTNWGKGYFKQNACEFCDDVMAETADITVGDAWLPEYQSDYLGTNLITVRHPELLKILEENELQGKIFLEELTEEKVYQTQAGGFRHRREGLAYRLHLKDKSNEWRPNKRVEPSDKMKNKRKKIYAMRSKLSKASLLAYKKAEEQNDFNVLKEHMKPLVQEYNKLNKRPFIIRALNKVQREVSKVIK